MCSSISTAPVRPSPPFDAALAALLDGHDLVLASNRGPVHFRMRGHAIESLPTAGGLASALCGLASFTSLTWIAAATNPADCLVANGASFGLAGPDSTRLRLVTTSEEAFNWHYRRFSNPVLWFLQHGLWDQLRRPRLTSIIQRGWELGYRPVNEAFARIIAEEVRRSARPIVQIHDYHLYLVPMILRRLAPWSLIEHFTHIPWPGPGTWEPLPPAIRRDICEGLLGADIVAFQTDTSAVNFLRCCERFVPGARVDHVRSVVWLEGRPTWVRAYPISVDPARLRRLASAPETLRSKEYLRHLCGERTIVRVDRLDPSKNIVMGFRAFGHLLDRRPDLRGRVRFLAFLVPSRETIAEYRRYTQEVWREVEAINTRFGRDGWRPIEVFYEDNRPQAIAGLALADVLLVNAIADGMNLVAKEGPIVSERDLVLVLSRGCGAHTQLGPAAISIPPLDLAATSGALEQALDMPPAERRRRATALRSAIEGYDLSRWIFQQVLDLLRLPC